MNAQNAEQSIFLHAIGLRTPEERVAYLDGACQGDHALRAQIDALLQAHDRLGGRPIPEPDETASFVPGDGSETAPFDSPLAAEDGAVIAGRYKLLEEIGEGGMGTVWMAEQTEPIQRRVAIKLVKAGMDTRQVLARFEAERQALALMDHPNIAKVLDAGAAPDGRPFFVMELVKGTPITKYCDQKKLTIRERLTLLADVCRAVQHAHQKGIIHRDLKPSNILIAPHDGHPVVKVIDFGVAKATGQKLTEKTLFTGFGAVVGTPEYMSPEQAELNNQDIDTRSDIYALGVLLYELLTGTTPLTRQRLKEGSLLDVLRHIREDDPPRPSTRLSTTEELANIASVRGVEPTRLSRLVRGELDWIAMKALDKDRTRRYETANGFAADIQRYLTDDPVQACPPSAVYRLRKFARRNRTRVAAATVFGIALLIAMSGVGYAVRDRTAVRAEADRELNAQAERAAWERERREAEIAREKEVRRAKANGELDSLVRQIIRYERNQEWGKALATARQIEVAIRSGDADPGTSRRAEQHLKALVLIDKLERIWFDSYGVRKEPAELVSREREYQQAFAAAGLSVTPETVPTLAVHLRSEWPAETLVPVSDGLMRWADVRFYAFGEDETDPAGMIPLDLADAIDPDPLRIASRNWMRAGEKDVEELEKLVSSPLVRNAPASTLVGIVDSVRTYLGFEAAYQLLAECYARDPGNLWVNNAIARLYANLGPEYNERLAEFTRANVALAPDRAKAWDDLGIALRVTNRIGGAVAAHRRAIELDPGRLIAYSRLASSLLQDKQPGEAAQWCRLAIEKDFDHPRAHYYLGKALWNTGRKADGIKEMEIAACLAPGFFEPRLDLGTLLRLEGRPDEAIKYLREAIPLAPDRPNAAWAHSDLGVLLARSEKLEVALTHAKKAWELNPEDFRFGWNLTHLLNQLDRRNEALQNQRQVVARHPKNAAMLNELAWALATDKDDILRDPDEALRFARRAVRLDPKWEYLDTLSVAAFHAGEHHEAHRARLEKMDLTKGGDCGDHFWLARTLAALERPDDARRELDRGIAAMKDLPKPDEQLTLLRRDAEREVKSAEPPQ